MDNLNNYSGHIQGRKKILFYYMFGIISGGSDHSLFYHIINLDKLKFEPIVMYMEKKNLVHNLEEKKISTIKNKYIKLKRLKNTQSIVFKFYGLVPFSKTLHTNLISFFEIIFLIKFIIQKKIDILHLNRGIEKDRPALIAGLLTGRKIFVHYRGLSKLNKLDVYLSRFVNKIFCISDFSKQEYLDSGIPASKCITIYNGVDTKRFISKKKQSNKFITIGNIGRLEHWKGHHIFIKAIPDIIKTNPEVRFLIVGTGIRKNELLKLADTLKVTDYITFLDASEKIEDVYNELDIFVHTSIEPEPFGRVIIEAMASGLPVISTDIGGPKEIITDGEDGILIAPGDSELLTEKIIFLIKNPEIRSQIGKRAFKTISIRFDIKLTTKKIEEIYSINATLCL